MQNNNVIKNILSNYKENELIFASKLYKSELCNQTSSYGTLFFFTRFFLFTKHLF